MISLDFSLTRRAVLRGMVVLGAVASAPFGTLRRAFAEPARPRFFSDHELATLEALCDRILPPDQDPGARDLGAARYVEALLTAFEPIVPRIFARGPFSGRTPFPDTRTGTPSHHHPPDFFRRSVAPSATQALYWRAQIYGGSAAGLPAQLEQQQGGMLRGLRDIYREGLARVDQEALTRMGKTFSDLDASEQDALFQQLDSPSVFPPEPVRGGRSFIDILIQHTLEGCLSAPEYGGNAGGRGWKLVGIEGDSQPLGYSIFSRLRGGYRERPDHPMSTPNPDEIAEDGSLAPRPLSADGLAVQQAIYSLASFLESVVPGSCM